MATKKQDLESNMTEVDTNAVDMPPVVESPKGSITLTVAGELYDNVTHTWYRTGVSVDAITPFLQAQIDAGLVSVN